MGNTSLTVPQFYKYGAGIRKRSRFAPTDESKNKGPSDDGEKDVERNNSQNATRSAEDEEELELDEEAGVPDKKELEEEIEHEREKALERERSRQARGDPFLDASGMEKAER